MVLASQWTGPRKRAGWNFSWRNKCVSFLRKAFCGTCPEWGHQEVRWCSVRGLAGFVYGMGGVSYFWRLSLPFEVFLAHPIRDNLMICLCWPRLSTWYSLELPEKRNFNRGTAWNSLTHGSVCGELPCLLIDVRGSITGAAPLLRRVVLAIWES